MQIRIKTSLISAYAVVWETDAPPDEDDDAARDPDDPEGKKSSSSFFEYSNTRQIILTG